MSVLMLLGKTLVFHWRSSLAVMAGVVVGAAALTGALLVGDSLRGSLRALTLDRLGKIDAALLTDRPFRADLAARLAKNNPDVAQAVPALMLRGAVVLRHADGTIARRVGRVQVVGVAPEFWQLFAARRDDLADGVIINQALATELNAAVGDRLEVRLDKPQYIPMDSLLGKRADESAVTIESSPLIEILPQRGPGQFSLNAQQHRPQLLYVQLGRLQRRLRESLQMPEPANAVLLSLHATGNEQGLQRRLQEVVDLEDLGLSLRRDASGRRYFSLESRRLLLDPLLVDQVKRIGAENGWEVRPTLAYLANVVTDDKGLVEAIASGLGHASDPSSPIAAVQLAQAASRFLPYSVVAGIEPDQPPPWGPIILISGEPAPPLGSDEILLSAWAARDLWPDGDWQRRLGKPVVTLRFFVEGDGSLLREEARTLKLVGIFRVEPPGLDPTLTPEFPGLRGTRIQDWKPPFPREQWHPEWVRERDEQYWRRYRAAPKAFVSPETAQALWQSRHGNFTSLRIAMPTRSAPSGAAQQEAIATDAQAIRSTLTQQLPAAELGLAILPVKARGLEAAASSTANMFGWLFLGFSSFLIVSAMMLVALLFRLGVERRAQELGLLFALGYRRRSVLLLLLLEGFLLACLGALAGIFAGVGYAWLLVNYLQQSWNGTLQTAGFLEFHIASQEAPYRALPYPSLMLGLLMTISVAMVALAWTAWSLSRQAPLSLLGGGQGADVAITASRPWVAWFTAGGFTLSLVLAGISFLVSPPNAPPLFFGSGGLLLVAALGLLAIGLGRKDHQLTEGTGHWPILRLGADNARRRRSRSLLTAGLLASAIFLIISVEAFRKSESTDAGGRDQGAGGFSLLAESDVPLPVNPASPKERRVLLAEHSEGELKQLEAQAGEARIIGCRLRSGDDVSCLNLYQPLEPRIVGVPPALIERGGFGSQAWSKLATAHKEGAVPVLADDHTAQWVLHKAIGDRWQIKDELGGTVTLELAGLLHGSVFQSELLMGEADFLRLFPSRGGYRLFLIETPAFQTRSTQQALELAFGEAFGFSVIRTADRLASFHAVENTYLSTFQMLGGLGLLLGTLGLGVILVRNILERRGELALLRALGWGQRDLLWLVMSEMVFLVTAGLGIGLGAALVAVAPHLFTRVQSVPWAGMTALVVLVLLTSCVAGGLSALLTLRAPLLPALRRE